MIEQTNQVEICLLLPAPASTTTVLDFWDISVNLLSHLKNLCLRRISSRWDFWILRSLCNDAKVVLDGSGGLQHSRRGCSLQWQLSGSSGPRAPLLTTPSTAGHQGTPAHQSHPQSWNKQKPLDNKRNTTCWGKVPSNALEPHCRRLEGRTVALPGRTTTWLLFINLQSSERELLCHLHEGCDGRRKERAQGYWLGLLKRDPRTRCSDGCGIGARYVKLKQKIPQPSPPPKVRRSRSLGVQNFTKAANC